jgi:hypothetical protein
VRKFLILLTVLSAMLLSACSLFEQADQSLKYADQATDHITILTDFAEQAPQMIKDAAADPDIKQQLEDRFLAIKTEIEQFNLIDAPSLARDLHEQLLEKNQVLLQEINRVLADGHLALDQLQNSPIISTISDITNLMNRIENLGL